MKKQDAENIQTITQGCIRELNMLLRIYQPSMDETEFKTLKSNIAQAMGRLIDIEELSVYNEFPELRPYRLSNEE
jgi:hypothetical protein